MNGLDTLRQAVADRFGFLTEAELAAVAADPATARRILLIRCGGCRFLAPADQVKHLIDIITQEGSDQVQDVSVPPNASWYDTPQWRSEHVEAGPEIDLGSGLR